MPRLLPLDSATRLLAWTLAVSSLAPLLASFLLLRHLPDGKWFHEPLHSALESTGSVIGMTLAVLLAIQSHPVQRDVPASRTWLILAMIGMSVLDAFHSVLRVNPAFFWTRALATLLGGLIFSLVLLPRSWSERLRARQSRAVLAMLGLSALLGLCLDLRPESLPAMFTERGYSPVAKGVNVVGGIGFLAASIPFARAYRSGREGENLVFANLCVLFGMAGILFAWSHMWGSVWWFFHFLRMSAYLVVLGYVFGRLRRQQAQLVAASQGMEKEVRERTEQLRASEDETRLIFELAPIGMGEADPRTGRLLRVNEQQCRMTGFTREELLSSRMDDLTHPEDRQADWEKFQRMVRGETPVYDNEKRYVRKDGRVIWVHATARVIPDAEGRPWRTIGVTKDITERRRSEESLRRAIQGRDEFLSIASHELRTPLTSLILQAQALRRSIARGDPAALAPERIQRLVDQTDRQTSRLARLVDDMLDVGRIRAGRLTIHKEELALADTVRDAVERLRPQFASEGVEVRLSVEDPARGAWDAGRIEQVVTNLLTNAIKYGQGRPIEVSVGRSGGMASLSVRDQGIGIAAGSLERIFDRFERAISANEVSGLGLGLFISRQIVLAHGGRIWVESEPGRGSTFRVELPLGAEDRLPSAPRSVVGRS